MLSKGFLHCVNVKTKFSLEKKFENGPHIKICFSSTPMFLLKRSIRSYHGLHDFLTKIIGLINEVHFQRLVYRKKLALFNNILQSHPVSSSYQIECGHRAKFSHNHRKWLTRLDFYCFKTLNVSSKIDCLNYYRLRWSFCLVTQYNCWIINKFKERHCNKWTQLKFGKQYLTVCQTFFLP